MREQEIDGVLAQIPRRRAVAARLGAGQARNRIIGAHEIGLLFGARLRRRRDVRPAVVRDLVAACNYRVAFARPALDGEAGDEPGRLDLTAFEKIEDAARADGPAEFAARQRRRRRHAAGDEAGLRVEIESQADDVAGHLRPYGASRRRRRSMIERRHDGQRKTRHHRQRRDRAHRLHAASGECAGADPRRRRRASGHRPHHAAHAAGWPQCDEAGRDRAAATASSIGRPTLDEALARPDFPIFFDAAATRQRVAVLTKAIAAGKHIYTEKPVAPSADEGLRCCRRRGRRASSTARSRTRFFCPACRSSSALASQGFFGRVTGFRLDFGWWVFDGAERPSQRPSWNYQKSGGGGLTLDMYPHWRYVIEGILGPIRRVTAAAATIDPRALR